MQLHTPLTYEYFRKASEYLSRDVKKKETLICDSVNVRGHLLEVTSYLCKSDEVRIRCLHIRAMDAHKWPSISPCIQVFQKLLMEPDRVRKQGECVQRASQKVCSELLRVIEDNRALSESLQNQFRKRSEAENVTNDLVRKLQLHQDTLWHRRCDVDGVLKRIKIEHARRKRLSEDNVNLDLSHRYIAGQTQNSYSRLLVNRKVVEGTNRKLGKRQRTSHASLHFLPSLSNQLDASEHILALSISEIADLKCRKEAVKSIVNLAVARLLQCEDTEKDKRKSLESALRGVASIEDKIASWCEEDCRQKKIMSLLKARREKNGRQLLHGKVTEKNFIKLLKVKELETLDLQKKCIDSGNRLKEFSALYDIVKNERNKYVNVIQSSLQSIAEMKEKKKILEREVETLRVESLTKDKVLTKELSQHLSTHAFRDGLRLELHKSRMEHRTKQEIIEELIVEITCLNSIVDRMEKTMVYMKNRYVNALEMRNAAGVSIIERNDELCILHEKKHLQEDTIEDGARWIFKKHQHIRNLKMSVAELNRKVSDSRALPQLSALSKTVSDSQKILKEKQDDTTCICLELESPSTSRRWRFLLGEDLDGNEMSLRIHLLQSSLLTIKERVLESELVLEELFHLSWKFKDSAKQNRRNLNKKCTDANSLRAEIQTFAKEIRALTSELSMYQAASSNLRKQYEGAVAKMKEALYLVLHEQSPSQEATKDLQRHCEYIRRRRCDFSLEHGQTIAVCSLFETRPNFYTPESSLGIPRPYGVLAPFKPTKSGSTIRHTRLPMPCTIFI